MDKGIISKTFGKNSGEKKQLTIIKSANNSPFYASIVAVYIGGIEDLYAITSTGQTTYIAKLSANNRSDSYDFYLNSSYDLILKCSTTSFSFRVRLLLIDYANIDLDGCMKDNSDTDLTKIDI